MRKAAGTTLIGLVLGLSLGCHAPEPGPDDLPPGAEARSLSGKPLFPPEPSTPTRRKELEAELQAAREAQKGDSENPAALIWVGRRLAYLGRYQESVEVFTEGIERFPGDPRFRRHRGHRLITLRQFAEAEADLAKAALMVKGKNDEVEPDGQPNARNIPTSTLNSNIFYHLGLARYLQGDFGGAEDAYEDCLAYSNNPDMLCATTYWLYLTRMRRGDEEGARASLFPIRTNLDVIENFDYYRLLLLYKGELTEADFMEEAESLGRSTVGYGLASHRLFSGDVAGTREALSKLLAEDMWAAFGYIAAESDLHDPTRLQS